MPIVSIEAFIKKNASWWQNSPDNKKTNLMTVSTLKEITEDGARQTQIKFLNKYGITREILPTKELEEIKESLSGTILLEREFISYILPKSLATKVFKSVSDADFMAIWDNTTEFKFNKCVENNKQIYKEKQEEKEIIWKNVIKEPGQNWEIGEEYPLKPGDFREMYKPRSETALHKENKLVLQFDDTTYADPSNFVMITFISVKADIFNRQEVTKQPILMNSVDMTLVSNTGELTLLTKLVNIMETIKPSKTWTNITASSTNK